MRDKTHEDQVERWAKFVKSHPRSEWIGPVKDFIDSQFIMSERFWKKLSGTKSGKEKIIKLYDIKNKKGYPKLLS